MFKYRCICLGLSAFAVMSFFIFPVSADDYFEEDTEYYEDVQPDEEEPEEPVEETEPPVTETEIFLPETTTVNVIETELTNYITAGAVKIVGAYYGVEVPDAVALKIAEVIRPVISDYNSVAVSEYVSSEIIKIVKEQFGDDVPQGLESELKNYIYNAFEEEPVENFNYFVPVISSLSFITIIGILIWIGL